MKLQLGINNVSNQEYHSDSEYLSSSDLKLILKSPAQFYKEKILGERERKELAAFDEGSYVHSLILEPEKVAEEYAFFDGFVKRGADFEQFKALAGNKTIISRPQKVRCKFLFDAYRRLPYAVHLITGGESEHSICQEIDGVKLKVRLDYFNLERGYIVDVKTSAFGVDRDSFLVTIQNFQYDLSAALYMMVTEHYYKKPFDFYFLALSKKDQNCEVFKVSERTKLLGKQKIKEALDLYKHCKATGIWEKPKENFDNVPELGDNDYEVLEV